MLRGRILASPVAAAALTVALPATAGKGKNRLLGGAGRDRLRGGPGRDRLRGGPGRDRQRQ